MDRVTNSVAYSIGPGSWYHFPETDVEIFIHGGPMVVLSVRKRLPAEKPVLTKEVKKNEA
jgi:hypothetical protein